MYCRNCGKEIDAQAVVCVHCGVPSNKGKNFCQACGAITHESDKNCLKCGVQLAGVGKDWLTTLLLLILLGPIGVHRFYTGNTLIGVLQLFTGGGCGVWWIIDLILLLTDQYRDGDGNIIKKDNTQIKI